MFKTWALATELAAVVVFSINCGPPCDAELECLVQSQADVDALAPFDRLSHAQISGADITVVNLPNLASINILIIFDSPKLTQIRLPALRSVGHVINVFGNDLLTDFETPQLTDANGLLFDNNAGLVGFGEMNSLARVSVLSILHHDALENVSAFDNIQSIDDHLWVFDNSALPQCEVDSLIAAIGEANINETRIHSNNGPGDCL